MSVIIIGALVLSVIAMHVMRGFGFSRWQVSLGCLVLCGALYVLNVLLIRYYIRRRAPEMDSIQEEAGGAQFWELSAGLGVVPKWVSVLGLLSVSALLTGVLPWIVALFK